MANVVEGHQHRIGEAEKFLGMGQPCPDDANAAADMIADECNTNAKIVVVEEAGWTMILPLNDADVKATLGNTINLWGTTDGQPPPGVASAWNTLSTPGMPNSNMVLRGIQMGCRVEPEGRTIKGNFFNPGSSPSLPMSPDVFTLNDQTNGALGLADGQGDFTPCELADGVASWKAALGFIMGYQLDWAQDNQHSLLKEPLTAIGGIEPFSEAMAAGTAMGTNLDRIRDLNDRLSDLGSEFVMLPITHKRIGGLTVASVSVGDFEVSREDDASPTVWGGIGTPGNSFRGRPPFIFNTPLFWPLGQPMSMKFKVYNDTWQESFWRWVSLTGSPTGGTDLKLQIAQQFAAATGWAPTTVSGNAALEQTIDLVPRNFGQAVQTVRSILKSGRLSLALGAVGRRVQDPWKPHVKAQIKAGAIQAPMGMGNL